jgi:hypothetical protein
MNEYSSERAKYTEERQASFSETSNPLYHTAKNKFRINE